MKIEHIEEGIRACKLFIKETPDDSRNKDIFSSLIELDKKRSYEGGFVDCRSSWSWLRGRGFLIHFPDPSKAVLGTNNIVKALNQSSDGIIAETRNFKFKITSDTS